eukprot:jgi/Botrbrau1/15218/Bobra.0149s0073.1
MEKYEKGPTLGQGTFGVVFQARNKETGQIVAIKKIRLGEAREGINMTALREIKLLRGAGEPVHCAASGRISPQAQRQPGVRVHGERFGGHHQGPQHRSVSVGCEGIHADGAGSSGLLSFSLGAPQGYQAQQLLADCHGGDEAGRFGLSRVFGQPDAKYTDQGVFTMVQSSRTAVWQYIVTALLWTSGAWVASLLSCSCGSHGCRETAT